MIVVDYNMASGGYLLTYPQFASPGTDLSLGARVETHDPEGNRCSAVVTSSAKDEIWLALDYASFAASETHDRIYA